MKKRRIVVGLVAALIVAGAFSVTALASGLGQNEDAAEQYALCVVESCTRVGYHSHDGTTYAPHSENDGHAYHLAEVEEVAAVQTLAVVEPVVCPVEDCARTTNHSHDGVTYTAHHAEDGHDYHTPTSVYQGVCPIEGCAATGDHAHDGGIYGQHHTEDGHAYHGQQSHESSGGHNSGGGHNGGGHH